MNYIFAAFFVLMTIVLAFFGLLGCVLAFDVNSPVHFVIGGFGVCMSIISAVQALMVIDEIAFERICNAPFAQQGGTEP